MRPRQDLSEDGDSVMKILSVEPLDKLESKINTSRHLYLVSDHIVE